MDKNNKSKHYQIIFFFFFFSKDQKRKLIKEWQIFDNEIKKGGIKKLIIKMFRSNHIWGWL